MEEKSMETKRNLNPKLLKQIRRVEPYVPGEQPQQKVIKLNTNENPYPPSPNVARVLKEMDADRICDLQSGADRVFERRQIFVQFLYDESDRACLRCGVGERRRIF